MTPDDLELVRWLAENVMGWTPTTFEEVQQMTGVPCDYFYVHEGKLWFYGPSAGHGDAWCDNWVWEPLTDDHDTHLLIERMEAAGFYWMAGHGKDSVPYCCSFSKTFSGTFTLADTWPRAVCRAAKAAWEGRKGKSAGEEGGG